MAKIIICVSDTHIGSTMGLCPLDGLPLPDGGRYIPNKFQAGLWRFWQHFWTEFAPQYIRRRDDVTIVINGDLIEGVHHRMVGIVTNNLQKQQEGAIQVYRSLPIKYHRLYVVRGSEAHSAPGAESEEIISAAIGAEPDEIGDYSRWQLWLDLDGVIFQFAHHIGVTSSAAYESSAPMREMVAGMIDAIQWGRRVPNVFVRSHRHRFIEVPLPTETGRIRCVITPAWQLRTPHVERIDRMRMPHIGGVVFKVEDGQCQVMEKMYRLPEPEPVMI
jgi:hypothetical protein